MSSACVIRTLLALFASGFGVFYIYRSDRQEKAAKPSQRYLTCFAAAGALPALIALLFEASLFRFDCHTAFKQISTFCFDIFLHISCYYLLLMIFLPVLRRYFSARVCAVLWLLPNYLYFAQIRPMQMDHPLLVLHLPIAHLNDLCLLWGIGFAFVLSCSIISHLLFRRKLMHHARPVTDVTIQSCWQRELDYAGIPNAKYKLVISDAVCTPLSIGFFERTIQVVLPNRSYTAEELSLILRHELVHIGRGDCKTKFFLTFCAAMCWFNPLMWIAMRRSAEDFELSCDETVLLNASPATRHLYADLLLRTAGEQRGFTTCLSSAASSLRYRLHNVLHPSKRLLGAVLSGSVFFVLIMSCGAVTFAYESGNAQEFIFMDRPLSDYSIQSTCLEDSRFYDCSNKSAALEHLASLQLDKIGSSYRFPTQAHKIVMILNGPEGRLGLSFNESVLTVTHFYKNPISQEEYRLNSPIDWDSFYSLFTEQKNT